MNSITKKFRARRNSVALQRAIQNAPTPGMRDELLAIAQHQLG